MAHIIDPVEVPDPDITVRFSGREFRLAVAAMQYAYEVDAFRPEPDRIIFQTLLALDPTGVIRDQDRHNI